MTPGLLLCYSVSQMDRDATLNLRLPKATRQALVKAAEDDNRNMSGMAVHLLTSWLQEHGYLPRPKARS